MAEIIQFVPKAECNAKENMQGFIETCRDHITVLGADLDWDSNYWDITNLIIKRGSKGPFAFIFNTFDSAGRKGKAVPMAKPFVDFAKSYMRYQHYLKPTADYGTRMTALRALEKALVECCKDGIPRAEMTDPHVLYRAVQIIREKSPNNSYPAANQLKMVGEFMVRHHLTKVPFIWKNPEKRQEYHNDRVGKKSEEARNAKMPSTEALHALANAFAIATDPIDIVSTSIAALMMCSPDRINEVLRLPVNCENKFVHNGEEQYGLRWWPSKGADPMVKPIISTMIDTAKAAIQKLREQTEEARRIALWYESNPERMYLPKRLEYLRNQEFLTTQEMCQVVGFSKISGASQWANAFGVRHIQADRPANGIGRPGNLYSFEDIQKVVVGMLPDDFPVYDRETGLKYSEALCVVPKYFFHQDRTIFPCMFETIQTNTVNNQLGAGSQHGKTCIFSRLGLLDEDGKPYKIRSHQFRHFLNTLAQKKNVDQLIIAMWSGRKDAKQNRAYDNRTPEEVLELMRQGDISQLNETPVEIIPNMPMTREQFMELKYPSVHTTQYGYCVHDWTLIPCQMHRACFDCTEHKCIKGDTMKTERVRQSLKDAEEQLARDKEALAEGYIGADRWHELTSKRVLRLRNLVQLFDNPDIPEGSIIELVNENEYSPIGLALNERQLLGDADAKMLRQVRMLNGTAAQISA